MTTGKKEPMGMVGVLLQCEVTNVESPTTPARLKVKVGPIYSQPRALNRALDTKIVLTLGTRSLKTALRNVLRDIVWRRKASFILEHAETRYGLPIVTVKVQNGPAKTQKPCRELVFMFCLVDIVEAVAILLHVRVSHHGPCDVCASLEAERAAGTIYSGVAGHIKDITMDGNQRALAVAIELSKLLWRHYTVRAAVNDRLETKLLAANAHEFAFELDTLCHRRVGPFPTVCDWR